MKSLFRFALATGLVVLLHALFQHGMSEGQVVTTLFSAGGSSAGATRLFALGFVALRITVIMVLPGLIAWRAADFLYQHLNRGARHDTA